MSEHKKSSRQLMAAACKSALRTRSALDELERRHPNRKEVRRAARRARKLERSLRDVQAIEAAVVVDEEERIAIYLELWDRAKQSQTSGHKTRPAEWYSIEPDPDTEAYDI